MGLDYRDYVRVDKRFQRPVEVDLIVGDSAKARRVLGWEPTCTFNQLVSEMVRKDLEALSTNSLAHGGPAIVA